MDQLIAKIADILEENDIDVTKKFEDYDNWDSLSALTLIATIDSDYGKQILNKDIASAESIEAFCKMILG